MIITNFKRRAKKIYLQFFRQGRYLKKGIICRSHWFGNDYGGFYACPDFLNQNSIVYSFGIGEDISFSRSLIEKYNCKVYGFDPTPKSIHWVHKQQKPERFQFFDYGIDRVSGLTNFHLPKNPDYVSGSIIEQSNVLSDQYIQVKMKSLSDIVKDLGHQMINILKLDIEGAEYDVLDNVMDSGIIIDQILVEFHDRYVANGKEKTKNVIKMMSRHGYEIFAISDTYDEISFINKALVDPGRM